MEIDDTTSERLALIVMAENALIRARQAYRKARREQWYRRAGKVLIVVYAIGIGYHLSRGNGSTAALYGLLAVVMVATNLLSTARIQLLVREGEMAIEEHDEMHALLAALSERESEEE